MNHHSHLGGRLCLGLASIAAATAMCGSTAIAQAPAPFVLDVPAKAVPVPATVSPQLQNIIGLPLRTNLNVLPISFDVWKQVAVYGESAIIKNIPGIRECSQVKID